MRFLVLVLIGLLAIPSLANAGACYNREQIKAEQLLRLHSKLMVITVTCRYGSAAQELVPLYTDFTRKNLSDIRDAEQTLIAFYKKNYGGDGVARLDKLRTLLGNEFGQQIAEESAPAFCAHYRDMVPASTQSQRAVLLRDAESLSASVKPYAPACDVKTASVR